MAQLSLGDIAVGYDEAGGAAGTPVLFVHGFPHNRRLWSPQLRALAGPSRCVAPDLRGFGETTVAPPYAMDQYADDLVHLMDALGIEQAVVCGLSMGGYIAFALWRRHRERVRALVLADTKAGADSEEARAKRREQIELVRARGAAVLADQLVSGMVGAGTRERSPSVVETLRGMMAGAPAEGVVGALEAMLARPDSRPTLSTIDVPTLVIVGAEDGLTPPAEAEAMHAAIAGSWLQVIPGAGHVSNLERPAAFNQVVSEFVRALGRP